MKIDDLYIDIYRREAIEEYTKEMSLLKEMIDILGEYVQDKNNYVKDIFSFPWVCKLYSDSIIKYAQMAYDNALIGFFEIVNMLNRTMIENIICYGVIVKYEEFDLWKYWIAHSAYNDIRGIPNGKKYVDEIFQILDIDDEFLDKEANSRRKKAYIELPYGWTYKVNKSFTFKGCCDLLDDRMYKDYQWMSKYIHGTSINIKISDFTFLETVYNMLTCFYVNLCKFYEIFCEWYPDDEIDRIIAEMDEIIALEHKTHMNKHIDFSLFDV